MGVVSPIAKDFAGCRASGGPSSRKLHDDGTPEHKNLNCNRESSRFLYVYSPPIPQLTQNMNSNGKSRIMRNKSLIVTVAAALVVFTTGCQTGTAVIGAPGLPTISLRVDNTATSNVTVTQGGAPQTVNGQLHLSFDAIAVAQCPSGVKSATIYLDGNPTYATFLPGSVPTYTTSGGQAQSGTTVNIAGSVTPLPIGSGSSQPVTDSMWLTASVTDFNGNTVTTPRVTINFTIPPSLTLTLLPASQTFPSNAGMETLLFQVVANGLSGGNTIPVSIQSSNPELVSVVGSPTQNIPPLSSNDSVQIQVNQNTTGMTGSATVTASTVPPFNSTLDIQASTSCQVNVGPAVSPPIVPTIISGTILPNLGQLPGNTNNSFFILQLAGTEFSQTSTVIVRPTIPLKDSSSSLLSQTPTNLTPTAVMDGGTVMNVLLDQPPLLDYILFGGPANTYQVWVVTNGVKSAPIVVTIP